MSKFVLRGWVVNVNMGHDAWAPTSQGQEWDLCAFQGHTGYSWPISEMCGPDAQGRSPEFPTNNKVAFSASGRASCHPGRTARALEGWPQPLTLSEPFPSLGFRFCAVQWAVSAVDLLLPPAQHLFSASQLLGIISNLLPVHTFAEGWSHVPLTSEMGMWSVSSQSRVPSSCGFKDENGTQAEQRSLKLWLFMEPKEGETLPSRKDMSGRQPGVAGGPWCRDRDCTCGWGHHKVT